MAVARLASIARIASVANSPVQLRSGLWRGTGHLYWQNRADAARVERMFLDFYGDARSLRRRAPYIHSMWTALPGCRGRTSDGSTVVWFARDGAPKAFDFARGTISSVVSADSARRFRQARELDLFAYFTTPSFTLEDDAAGGFVKREPLLEVPCVGLRSRPEQLATLRTIARTSTRYALATAHDPDPARFLRCFDEVAGCLDGPERARLEFARPAFTAFVRAARTVVSHLDFNVANFIGGGDRPLVLVDIADAGLLLPATYDLNNLLLNEVYQSRSTHLLRSALADPLGTGCDELLRATLTPPSGTRSDARDLERSLLVNFVLRESRLVALRLRGTWSAQQVRASWQLFSTRVDGWPLALGVRPGASLRLRSPTVEPRRATDREADMRLSFPESDLVHEVIDGEVVLLNLSSGCYYSGNRSATVLIEALLAEPDLEVLQTSLASLADPGPAAADVRRTVTEAVEYLLAEGLLIQDSAMQDSATAHAATQGAAPVELLIQLLTQAAPVFERFTDMQDILLLDPVHDVTDAGWPHRPGAAH